MKLVHTSDWHIGAWLGAIDRRPDLEAAIDGLVDLVAEVRPDLILHTGDLFDRSLPGGDDMRFAADALSRLAAVAPVLVLCGNHDGRQTFAALNTFASIGGDRLRLLAQIDIRQPVLSWPTANGGRLRIGAVPYQPLAAAGFAALAEGTVSGGAYADRIRQLWALIGAAFERDRGPGDVDVAAAHLHVSGAVLARSEKAVHVGDDAATDPSALPAVSYAGYGHIHKPQALPGAAAGRYAGSIIQIDFGEAGEQKGAVVVDAAPGRAARIEPVVLASGRPLVSVTRALADLPELLAGHPGSILRISVTDPDRVEQLADRVADLLPEGSSCHSVVQPSLARPAATATAAGADPEASVLTLLSEYATTVHGRAEVVTALTELWSEALADPDADLTDGAVAELTHTLEAG